MVASYPTSYRIFSTKVDYTDTNWAAHINALQEEVVALQHTAGTNPHVVGQGDDNTIGGRLRVVETSITNIGSTHSHAHSALFGLARDDHLQYFNATRHNDPAAHGGSVVDHGLVAGLGDDDHPHYITVTRHALVSHSFVTDLSHGNLQNLGTGDPHTQYLTPQRHDARAHGFIAGVPTGAMMLWPLVVPPSGWLLCNGQAISRTTFDGLFGVLGTQYGAGNGSSTFNVPDYRGRVPVGAAPLTPLGTTGGASTVALTTAQLPSHTHTPALGNGGQHSHGVTVNADSHGHSISIVTASHGHGVTTQGHSHSHSGSAAAHSHGHALDNVYDGSTSHNHRLASGVYGTGVAAVPSNVMGSNRDWQVTDNATHSHALSLSSSNHDHDVNLAANSHGHSASSGNDSHSHATTIGTALSHDHSISVASTGSGQAHENMPPWLAANMIIKA